MKEVVAFLRRSRLRRTLELLREGGFPTATTRRVLGRGREGGLRYSSRPGEGASPAGARMSFLPREMVSLVVRDVEVQKVVLLLLSANKSGEIGDGKIFVLPLADAVRVRTGEGGGLGI